MKSIKTLVIGGSGNLGEAVCHTLVREGFDLAFTYFKQQEKAEKLVSTLRQENQQVYTLPLNLHNLDDIRQTIEKANTLLGGLDALIITAGLASRQEWKGQQGFLEIDDVGFDRMISVNVRGVFFACQTAARIMIEKNSGKIVITGSIDGVKAVPSPVDYACCKGALWGLTRSLAKELGQYGILVNMIAPGLLEGGIGNELSEKLKKDYIKHCSLKRVGKFSEIAQMVAFLVGKRNTYLTGQAIILDGGL